MGRASEEQLNDALSGSGIVDGGRVVIGMDPHKRSVTIKVMTADQTVLGGGRHAADEAGVAAMRRSVGQFPDRI